MEVSIGKSPRNGGFSSQPCLITGGYGSKLERLSQPRLLDHSNRHCDLLVVHRKTAKGRVFLERQSRGSDLNKRTFFSFGVTFGRSQPWKIILPLQPPKQIASLIHVVLHLDAENQAN